MKSILIGTLAAILAVGAQSNEAARQLKAAMNAELMNGDLKMAIKQYGEIAAKYKNDRAVAAMALVRMAECYQKMGATEANRIYERVIREFADQKEAVAVANERLGNFEATRPPALSNGQLWSFSGTNATLGSPSADGRYLAFSEFTGKGDLAVRNLSTGEIRRVTNKPTTAVTEYATDSCLSPDGKRIAYTWHGEVDYELRVIDLDGSNQKTVHRNPETEWVRPIGFSAAGDEVLAIIRQRGQIGRIVWVPLNGGALRVLKSMPWNTLGGVTLSADGRFVAYDLSVKDDSPNRALYALASDGSREIRLTDGSATDEVFGWMADGRWLLFATNRTGNRELWALPLENGMASKPPVLVKPDLGGVRPLGITKSGSLLYNRYVTAGRVYTAFVDLATGKMADSTPLEQRAVPDFGIDISRDGRFLAYVAHQGSELSSRFIVVHDLVSGEVREVRPRQALQIHVTGGDKWSPDGRSYLVTGDTPKSGQGIYAIDIPTGDVRLLVNLPELQAVTPDWLDGGRAVIYCARDAGRSERIFVRNLETGVDREIATGFEGARHINFVVQPDGNRLAFAPEEERSYRAVHVMTIGGTPHKIYELPEGQSLFLNGWTKDGRRLLFAKTDTTGSRPSWSLWSIPAEGGEPSRISVPPNARFDFRIGPAGNRIFYSVTKTDTEVWSLENIRAALSRWR